MDIENILSEYRDGDYDYRVVGPDDRKMHKAIAALERRAFAGQPASVASTAESVCEATRNGHVIAVFEGTELVAVTNLIIEEPVETFAGLLPSEAAYCDGAVVAPGHRGKGLQKAFLKLREAIAKQLGKRYLYALVRPSNVASLRSLMSAGFVIVDARQAYGEEPSGFRLVMLKLIDGRATLDRVPEDVQFVTVAQNSSADESLNSSMQKLLDQGYIGVSYREFSSQTRLCKLAFVDWEQVSEPWRECILDASSALRFGDIVEAYSRTIRGYSFAIARAYDGDILRRINGLWGSFQSSVPGVDEEYILSMLEAAATRDKGFLLVCCNKQGDIIAAASLSRLMDTGYAGYTGLNDVVVGKEHRGQGLMGRLIELSELIMRAAGKSTIGADVHPWNLASLKSFLRANFAIVGIIPRGMFWPEPEEPHCLLSLRKVLDEEPLMPGAFPALILQISGTPDEAINRLIETLLSEGCIGWGYQEGPQRSCRVAFYPRDQISPSWSGHIQESGI